MHERFVGKIFYPEKPEYSRLSKEINISPTQLTAYFSQHPLGRYFVDWVADQGFMMRYNLRMKNAEGYTLFGARTIVIKDGMPKDKTNLTIMHELVHIAVPYAHGYFGIERNKGIEEAISEVALPYSANEEFMKYIKEKIPSFSAFSHRRLRFPNWPIPGNNADWIVNPPQISYL